MPRCTMVGIACCATLLLGCRGSEPKRADTAVGETVAAPPATATMSPTISLADVAGRWTVRSIPLTGDTTKVTTLVLSATADTSGWTIEYPPNPKPIGMRVVAVAGDSIVTEVGPYLSARFPGRKAISHDVWRLQDGRLVGMGGGHYLGVRPDSVFRVRLEGVRAP